MQFTKITDHPNAAGRRRRRPPPPSHLCLSSLSFCLSVLRLFLIPNLSLFVREC